MSGLFFVFNKHVFSRRRRVRRGFIIKPNYKFLFANFAPLREDKSFYISCQGAKNAKDDPVIIYQKTGPIFSLRSLRLCES